MVDLQKRFIPVWAAFRKGLQERVHTERFWRWAAANFVISSLPLFFPFIISFALGKPTPEFYDTVKHGDTYLFCAIVLIGTMGELFGSDKDYKKTKIILGSFSAGIILISTLLYTNFTAQFNDAEAEASSGISVIKPMIKTEQKNQAVLTAVSFMLVTGIVGAVCIVCTEDMSRKTTP